MAILSRKQSILSVMIIDNFIKKCYDTGRIEEEEKEDEDTTTEGQYLSHY